MKRIISISIICLLSVFAFSGCGIEGGTASAGIEFVRDVFYVDYNVETFLEYKAYPSTANVSYVTYEPQPDIDQTSYFNFTKDGKITVTNKRFTKIDVVVKLDEYTDICQVRLKEYPTTIRFQETQNYIEAGSVYALDLMGVFPEEVRACENGEFNYKIESSNTSVIEVVSCDALLVKSTGRRGSAEIKVSIYNSAGLLMSGLDAKINLVVVENISDAFVSLGSDLVVKNGSSNTIEMLANEQRLLQVLFFNNDGIQNTLTDYNVYLSNDQAFEIVKDGGLVYLKLKDLQPIQDELYQVVLTIQSTGLKTNGEPFKLVCEIKVRVLE